MFSLCRFIACILVYWITSNIRLACKFIFFGKLFCFNFGAKIYNKKGYDHFVEHLIPYFLTFLVFWFQTVHSRAPCTFAVCRLKMAYITRQTHHFLKTFSKCFVETLLDCVKLMLKQVLVSIPGSDFFFKILRVSQGVLLPPKPMAG